MPVFTVKVILNAVMNELPNLILEPGTIAVVPTDTVYGVVARALDHEGVKNLYKLKDRENKPGTIIAASVDQLVGLGISLDEINKVSKFWPGPVSIILSVGNDMTWLSQGKNSLAVRIPSDNALLGLLQKTGPLITSSANQPGEPPANTIDEAKAYFGDQVDIYVDGGDLSERQASTIIKLTNDKIEVIRPGAIDIDIYG